MRPRRARLRRPTRIGLVLLALGTGPLLLYIVFGPRDGNPIGLGLLFFFSFPVAAFFLLWGGAAALFHRLRHGPPGPPSPEDPAGREGPLRLRGPGSQGRSPAGPARLPRKNPDDWP